MGFCLFNNAVIAARHAQRAHGADRVAIVDWDVHHGNGTQAIVWSDPTILYASTHQMPLYPGTGAASETGVGNIFNAPLPPGAGGAEFNDAFSQRVLPAIDALRARPHRHLGRLRRPLARSARLAQPHRRRFRLGDRRSCMEIADRTPAGASSACSKAAMI